MPLRIVTWNVNGIRSPFSYPPWREDRSLKTMFDILEADIVILQELKVQGNRLQEDMVLVDGWDCYFSLPQNKTGYSGVAIYTRQSTCTPIRAEEGVTGLLFPPNCSIPFSETAPERVIGGYLNRFQETDLRARTLDSEGRCVVLEFPAFVLLGIYSPANSDGTRDDFRRHFLLALEIRIRNLIQMGKNVVVAGDLNVLASEIDTAAPEQFTSSNGSSHEGCGLMSMTTVFNRLLEGGAGEGSQDSGRDEPVLWDMCRGFHPQRQGMYTHWDQKINARPGNFGTRIDYILCSLSMKSWFSESNIQAHLMGSDHCPVYAVMKDVVTVGEQQVPIRDIMNPQGMFKNGVRQRAFNRSDLCPASARRRPEFRQQQTLITREMFAGFPFFNAGTSFPPSHAFERRAPFPEDDSTQPIIEEPIEEQVCPDDCVAGPSQAVGLAVESLTTALPSRAVQSIATARNAAPSPDRKRAPLEAVGDRPKKKRKSGLRNVSVPSVPSSASVRPRKKTSHRRVTAPFSSRTAGQGQQRLDGFFASRPLRPPPANMAVPSPANRALSSSANRTLPSSADRALLPAANDTSSENNLYEDGNDHEQPESPGSRTVQWRAPSSQTTSSTLVLGSQEASTSKPNPPRAFTVPVAEVPDSQEAPGTSDDDGASSVMPNTPEDSVPIEDTPPPSPRRLSQPPSSSEDSSSRSGSPESIHMITDSFDYASNKDVDPKGFGVVDRAPITTPRDARRQDPITESQDVSTEEFTDTEFYRLSWDRLFHKPVKPRCQGHHEPCKIKKVKKSGKYCGRFYWMCARPIGPDGKAQRGTDWACPTWIWNSQVARHARVA